MWAVSSGPWPQYPRSRQPCPEQRSRHLSAHLEAPRVSIPSAQGLFWRGRYRGVLRNDGSRLLRQKFLLPGRKDPIPADPLLIHHFEFGDEQILVTQCHRPAAGGHVPTSNRNRPLAITDGSLSHALLPLVVLPGLGGQAERVTPPTVA